MGEITVEAVYPHPPERVWRALTDPDEMEAPVSGWSTQDSGASAGSSPG
jgi:uncharacterized protein YndB with AHSA1/START domain